MKPQATLAELLQAFFTEWLMGQRNASPHTIANYRDTFRLLLAFGCRGRGLKKTPAALSVQDLDAPLIVRFLDHLEKQRNNTPQSRNVRLAAIHSFFQYVALREPGLGAVAQRVLAIPSKRCTKKPVDFLSRAETEALLKAPDQNTWSGRRDHAWLLVAVQTGLRVSELIGLRCQDVACGSGGSVMNTWIRPKYTYTQTSNSRNRRSPKPNPSPDSPAATVHRIGFWPSSRASDNAESTTGKRGDSLGFQRITPHTRHYLGHGIKEIMPSSA